MIPYYNNARKLISRNASDLLLLGGVGCIIGGGILGIRQTPKAVQILKRHEEETTMTKIKVVAPLYVPSVLLAGVGIAQIVSSRNITNNKLAAMATAYTVSETAFKTYRAKVRDIIEPEQYDRVKQEVALDRMQKDPVSNKEVIINPNGNVLIYDNMSGRYFKGDMNDIEKCVNTLNKRMRSEMTIQLNELYSEIGLPPIKMGCELGWSIDNEEIDVTFTSTIAENGEPCLVIDYDVIPMR